MEFSGFVESDFTLFTIPGFEERMAALRGQLSPKFAAIGAALKDQVSVLVGDEVFPHVAKHARRRTNPPNDSWVAFGGKRGYKMGPHFQVCVWPSHVLIQWGLIYEANNKATFAHNLMKNLHGVRTIIPSDYQWSKDHMKPEGIMQADMTDEDFGDFADRLQHRKNGEVMVGKVLPREVAIQMDGSTFLDSAMEAFGHLNYLHRLARTESPSLMFT